ncbi:hypothetical protein DFH08DRAFT_885732 [Mycena albidolilacea]|uniref:RING-type domain-containing protein n=1 Tax=Mycena albidolilacea TaxID=1033008 RepID=A0AAD7EJ84_9AGAR|nr:hypothetical protein DFH08DRAFT_885732 [Mycena albidolilacea]
MPSNTRSSKATAASDVVLLTDADVRSIKRTTKKDPKQKPARKENNPPPVNTGEIIEISSDEEEPAPRNPVAATAKLQARIQQLEKENARIKKENDEIKKQQIAAADLEDQITCEVCSAKLWSPFILNCGHTFCQQDLENWFSTALKQHLNVYPHYNVNVPPANVYGIFQKLPLPPYSCPKCREKVCSRPIQNFAVKGLVRAVAGQTGETSPKKTIDATKVWSRFFPAQ